MWTVQVTDITGKSIVINSLFPQKNEAIKFAKARFENNDISNIELKNIERDILSDDLKIGSNILIKSQNANTPYGKVVDITNYLIEIEKCSGEVAVFTKNRFNKELLNGLFIIDKKIME